MLGSVRFIKALQTLVVLAGWLGACLPLFGQPASTFEAVGETRAQY